MSSEGSTGCSTVVANDTFPEVAFFEVPSDASKSSASRHKEVVKHPAFRQISAINGEINRMNVKHLKIELEKLNFDGRGGKDVLKKRLKAYERARILKEVGIEDPNIDQQHYTHIVVIDFEATCEEHQTKDYVHEIIEFPAVLVRVADAARVGEFHSLVRPVLNPLLSDFCKQLTGIDQTSVDAAPTFPEVLRDFECWLAEKGVGSAVTFEASPSSAEGTLASQSGQSPEAGGGNCTFAVATDGPWDMARFLLMQCSVSELPFPSWARSWINLRKVFSNFYAMKRLCLSEMLAALGLEFSGRPHCGLDDARNIAVIAEALLRDGATLRVNETIAHLPHCAPPSLKGSSVANVTLKDFKSSQRRRYKSSGAGFSDQEEVRNVSSAVASGGDSGFEGSIDGSSNGGSGEIACGTGDGGSEIPCATVDGGGEMAFASCDGGSEITSAPCDSSRKTSCGSGDGGVCCARGSNAEKHGDSSNGNDLRKCSSDCSIGATPSGVRGNVDVCNTSLGTSNCCNGVGDEDDDDDGGGGGGGLNKVQLSNRCENHRSEDGAGKPGGDGSDGCVLKDLMKKPYREVYDLNVDISNTSSTKCVNGSLHGPCNGVTGHDGPDGSLVKAPTTSYSRHSNLQRNIHDRNVIESNILPQTNAAYHSIVYNSHTDSGHTFTPRFDNRCSSNASNFSVDSRCRAKCDGSEFSIDPRVENVDSQQCSFMAINPGHSRSNNPRQSKNNTREPLPYENFYDSRYVHYTHINSKTNRVPNRRDYKDSHGNSGLSKELELNTYGRKRNGGPNPANSKPGRRGNNHRGSQYGSGSSGERYAPNAQRPPNFNRDASHSTNGEASQSFYSNATMSDELSTHKNIDFNDSTQFPVLGSIRRNK